MREIVDTLIYTYTGGWLTKQIKTNNSFSLFKVNF